ncbi:SpoIIE family protein phosphatase [Pseudonocardia sp. RS010]|uniref:SpoIIE family protein phosphatase n=1 Tax=Pseudonocardia sp. RS010 TaxID=3385979 RepID=UPI0039A314CE
MAPLIMGNPDRPSTPPATAHSSVPPNRRRRRSSPSWRPSDHPGPVPHGPAGHPTCEGPLTMSDDAVRDDDTEDLYDHAPCGYLSTGADGTLVRVNHTLAEWLGRPREQLLGARFVDLLTVGGRLHHETHFAPLLAMQGSVSNIATEMRCADGSRLPVLLSSVIRRDARGRPVLVRTIVFEAGDRRRYERELLAARRQAERDRDRAQRLAAVLQRTLFPPTLAEVPGLETAAYYRPGAQDVVGSDFYDLFPLHGDRWGLFIGDVCGRGPAAAALTSLTRYTLRAAVVHDPDPRAVLGTLSSVLAQEGSGDTPALCTGW